MLLIDLFSLRGLDPKDVTDVVIGSVVPNLTPALEEASEVHLKLKPIIVGPGVKTGIRIAIENPKEVGADRILERGDEECRRLALRCFAQVAAHRDALAITDGRRHPVLRVPGLESVPGLVHGFSTLALGSVISM